MKKNSDFFSVKKLVKILLLSRDDFSNGKLFGTKKDLEQKVISKLFE